MALVRRICEVEAVAAGIELVGGFVRLWAAKFVWLLKKSEPGYATVNYYELGWSNGSGVAVL